MDEVRSTISGVLLVAAADIAILFACGCIIALLIHDAAAISAEQHTGKQTNLVIEVTIRRLAGQWFSTHALGVKNRFDFFARVPHHPFVEQVA